MEVIPEQFRYGAYTAFKEYLSEQKFNNNIEANKCKMAYMDSFVTAIFMTNQDIE